MQAGSGGNSRRAGGGLTRRQLGRVAAAGALAAAARPALAAEPVRIGLLTSFAGGQLGGKTVVAAAQMAIEDFGGKMLGRDIQLLVEDYQLKPDVASLIARRWLTQERVAAVVPNTISAAAFAVLGLANEHKVPVLLAGPGSEDLTGKSCSPFAIQFIWDTYSLSRAVVNGLAKLDLRNWYLIAVDNAYGASVEVNLREFVGKAGGRLAGVTRHAIGTTDYSSMLLQAQASGAQVVALGSTSDDLVNLIKQAGEFGLARSGMRLAVLSMNIQDVHAVGLAAAQGLQLVTPFYQYRDADSEAWTKRYMARPNAAAPTLIEAGNYSAVNHFLRAVQAAGTTDGPAVMQQMHALRIDDFQMKGVAVRADGQAMRPMYIARVKTPAESKFPFDYYDIQATVPAEDAWRPAAESACRLLQAAR